MSLITATALAKSFGPEDIFANISLSVPQRARIAIVGPNGIGKTTLLRILARGGAALGGDDIGSDASLAVKAAWSLIGGELFRWVAQTPFMW